MKHAVVTPSAALVLLLLLLLMVQLAGLNVSSNRSQPNTLEPPSLNISDMSFSQANTEPAIEPKLLNIPTEQEVATEPLMDFKPVEPNSPLAEIMEQIEEIELVNEVLPELDISLQLDVNNNVLDGVLIAAPKKKARIHKKAIISKKPTKKAVKVKKAVTSTAKAAKPSKAVNKNPSTAKSNPSPTTNKRLSGPISRVKPSYPKRAQRRGVEGRVVASFIVNKNGSVDKGSIKIVRAIPAKVFNKSVRKALARWKFSPTEKAYRTQYTLEFSLQGK